MDFPAALALADRASLSILGGSVTYAPTVGSPVTVRGVFDASYQLVDAGHAGVSSAGPAVFLVLSDLPSDPESDNALITVAAVQYEIRETKKDGIGGVVLLLHRT